jgi:hypothetical protein
MRVVARSSKAMGMTVDEAVEADWQYFCAHPDEDEYIREFVSGEFGKAELPQIPDGFRFATHVSVKMRQEGKPVGRCRRLMMVSGQRQPQDWWW